MKWHCQNRHESMGRTGRKTANDKVRWKGLLLFRTGGQRLKVRKARASVAQWMHLSHKDEC